MIDLGLSKLAIIGVVALVVIGPEKLPRVARMAGTLYGRAQRYLHDVKSEVSREIELDELRNLQKEVQETAQSIKDSVENTIAQNIDDVDAAWRDLPSSTAPSATMSDLERKARDFRRKKLVRNSAVPGWYKQRHGGKAHIMSGAARVKKFRPRSSNTSSFF
ncbi:Sec-independent protein translocase protein TatB [Massilia sp. P8910]|uniref:Sec-independent protein translocase protein TatB n=1 Tax=Massilia antarctica TaxID=2765360 RepID=UPI0006BB81AC|nr:MULTISPECIES: Sec-independent protein translocase protein TatB [Massilia]MCE3603511.1 Sec-independent protein translocase protein TatB [Massilia antarctica]MCY0915842.1 Sec-independent protein translocase protein TatB [Massilia sp. H27-R4]CUI06113.1 Twin-arginine translocation protein TatB [Janthinobacterium sp. CG23_2]CUU29899.1 Twin-arginine translocation protein TatB [Janthinobacterium sp. CG23_2]